MKKNKALTIIGAVALLAVGYILGVYVGFPPLNDSLLNGDVSKANVSDMEESEFKIMSDLQLIVSDNASPEEIALLSSRIDDIEAMSDATLAATKDSKEFEKVNKYFTSLKHKADVAKENLTNLREANEKVAKGEAVENIHYLESKALLALYALDHDIYNGAIGNMLDYSREMESQDVANTLAKWIDLTSDDAKGKAEANDVAYWQGVYKTLGIDENGSRDLATAKE